MSSFLSLPALHASHAGIWLVGPDGVRAVGRGEAIRAVAETPHLILNAPLTGQRLGYPEVSGLDLLELFAFVHPARFVVPTVAGLAGWCGLDPTNGIFAGSDHIVLAIGRDYADVAPVGGVIFASGSQRLDVAVSVTPVGASS